MTVLISRAEARARGLTRYFTGKPCLHGHICERRVSNTACVFCNVVSQREVRRRIATDPIRRARTNERENLYRRERAANDLEYRRRRRRQGREYYRQKYAENSEFREKRLAKSKEYSKLRWSVDEEYRNNKRKKRAMFRAEAMGVIKVFRSMGLVPLRKMTQAELAAARAIFRETVT